jgi:serine/threonine protein kinase
MNPCPTSEQLERFLAQRLDSPDSEAVEDHIEECAECRETLEQMTGDGESPRPSRANPEVDERIARLLDNIEAKGPRLEDSDQPSLDGRQSSRRPGVLPAIDGFQIFRQIGRGGMGIVYEAEDQRLNRRVALKLLPFNALVEPKQVERFRREAQAAARLHHTNIVPVFGVGEQDGHHYYLMQYIEGYALDVVLDELRRVRGASSPSRDPGERPRVDGPPPSDRSTPPDASHHAEAALTRVARSLATGQFGEDAFPPGSETSTEERLGQTAVFPPPIIPSGLLPSDRARIFLPGSGEISTQTDFEPPFYHAVARIGVQVADALDYANRQGVLHRDIKPSNLLLDVRGNVWVADFGLAKTIEADGLTPTGDIVGTVRYMAPERFRGRCDARADVYSLGLSLYELAAKRPAFEDEDRFQLIERIRCGELPWLRTRAPKVPRNLDTIIHKAIAREPDQRYATAAALADDLRRFLDGRTILARRSSVPERAVRWCRRNPWAAASIAILVVGTLVSATLAVRARRAESATRDQRNRAERARDRAFGAINAIVLTDKDQMASEELRPYRELLIDEGLRLATEIVAEPEGDPRGQQAHAEALMAQAKLLQEKGERDPARRVGLQAVAVARALVASDPASVDHRAALARLLHQAAVLTDDFQASRADATESNRIYEDVLRETPRSDRTDEWAGDVALNFRHIGHMYFGEKWELRSPERVELLRQAIDAFLAGKDLSERQIGVVASQRRDGFVYSLALNEIYLCRAHRTLAVQYKDGADRREQIRKAVEYGNQAISHFQALVDRNPDYYQYGSQLHVALQEVGDMYAAAEQVNDPIAAIPYYNRSRETLKAMAVRHGKLVSRVAAIYRLLVTVDFNLQLAYNADLARYYDGPRRAIFSEILEICDKLSLVQPLSPELQKVHAQACLAMVDYQSLDGERPDIALCLRAEPIWDQLYRGDPRNIEAAGMLAVARRTLADVLEERGQPGDAARWRCRSLEPVRGNPELFYILAANAYAVTARYVVVLPTKLGRDQIEKQRGHAIAEGIAMLREAIAAGFRDLGRLRNDPQLAPMRGSPEFHALILEILDLQFPADVFAQLDRSSGTLLQSAGSRPSGPAQTCRALPLDLRRRAGLLAGRGTRRAGPHSEQVPQTRSAHHC